MEAEVSKSRAQAVLLVLFTVVLGLVSAFCLKETALADNITATMLLMVLGVVATVNVGRFWLWGYIHRHFPLSFSYPLNSLFFPLILILSYYYGEVIRLMQIVGVVMITSGVAILAYEGR